MRDDLAADADGVALVLGEVVGDAGDAAVHLGAAELLLVLSSSIAIFTSGGPPRKTLAPPFTMTM